MQQQKVIGDYLLTNKVLGSGNFAQVRLGQHRHTNQSVAVKVIDKTQLSKKMEKQLRFEVHLLRDVLRGHEGIVQLFDVVEEEDFVYLVMEHINGGDLFDFLMSRGGKLAPSIVRLLFIQMAQALRFCHDKGVVHHDLKLENLLIHLQHQQNDSQESDDDEEEEENNQRLGNLFTVKVIDFGLAALCPSEDSQLSKFCGTESYCPPEILDGRRSYLGRKVDVYSLGVVLFALLTGSFPFCPDDVNLQWQQQTDFGFLSSLRFGSAASLEEQQLLREAKDLVLQLLNPNAKLRPSLQQVLEHPFVSSSTISSSRKQQQQSPCKRKRGGETLRSVSFPKEDLVFCFDEELSSTSGGEEEVKKQQKEQSNKWRDCLLLDESDWEEYEEEEEEEDDAWWSYGSMDEERSFFVA
ncbi:Serine/threonine-protein kinase brsk1 [Balamuthia mandrillaris]